MNPLEDTLLFNLPVFFLFIILIAVANKYPKFGFANLILLLIYVLVINYQVFKLEEASDQFTLSFSMVVFVFVHLGIITALFLAKFVVSKIRERITGFVND